MEVSVIGSKWTGEKFVSIMDLVAHLCLIKKNYQEQKDVLIFIDKLENDLVLEAQRHKFKG